MNIFVDIDHTICDSKPPDYIDSATPRVDDIKYINELYDVGHTIIYWTARGSGSGIDWGPETKKQLDGWGVKYHEIRLKKPVYDVFVDDRCLSTILQLKEWIKQREG